MKQRLISVKEIMEKAAIKSKRDISEVELIAVTKTRNVEIIDKAYELGLNAFGENRVQELEEKIALRPDYNWHMIGTLQSNKVRFIFDKVSLIHSLDRKSLAKEIEKRAKSKDIVVNSLVQINVVGEESKSGLSPEESFKFFEYLANKPHINVIGLMTMAPHTEDEKILRKVFSGLRDLKEQLNQEFFQNEQLTHLSMGMSNDYKIAIEEGSTMIRVGSAIFGDYNY